MQDRTQLSVHISYADVHDLVMTRHSRLVSFIFIHIDARYEFLRFIRQPIVPTIILLAAYADAARNRRASRKI